MVSVLLVAPLSLACPQPAVMDATAVSRILWKTRDLFQTDLHAVIRCGAGIPKFKLCYLPCRNRVEIARLILEEAQCAYDFEVVGFRQWAEYVKQQTPHGKCPVLRDYDGSGQVLDQEGAITRFLAQRVGLAGSNALEQAKVDALYCQLFSTLRNNGVSHDGEQYSVRALKAYAGVQHGAGEEGASASRAVPRYRESFRRTYMSDSVTLAERSLSALGVFEERLETNDTGYLCGDAPTYVDLALVRTHAHLRSATMQSTTAQGVGFLSNSPPACVCAVTSSTYSGSSQRRTTCPTLTHALGFPVSAPSCVLSSVDRICATIFTPHGVCRATVAMRRLVPAFTFTYPGAARRSAENTNTC